MYHDTMRLLEIVGLPDAQAGSVNDLSEDSLLGLLHPAIENRIPLLFLERAVTLSKSSRRMETLHKAYLEKAQSFFSLMKEVSKFLVKAQTDYVVFKTFKPFPFVTVDIDVLFFNREEFLRAYRSLRGFYKLAGYGAHSISLYSPKHAMNLDLQLEISVSRLVYIYKNLLREHVTEINLNGSQVRVLELPAALITVLAHSLYKEQIFTLSDYYTSMIHLLNMTNQQRRTFVDLAEQAHIGLGIKVVLMLINTLTTMAFGRNVPAITETTQMIQAGEIEDKMMQLTLGHFAQNSRLPYKYHPIALGAAFTAKVLKDPLMRGAIPQQFVELITNTSEFLDFILLHMRRETY